MSWAKEFDSNAQLFYYYNDAGETTWVRPDEYVSDNEGEIDNTENEMVTEEGSTIEDVYDEETHDNIDGDDNVNLTTAWNRAYDENVKMYYYYNDAGETTWEKPENYIPEANEEEEDEREEIDEEDKEDYHGMVDTELESEREKKLLTAESNQSSPIQMVQEVKVRQEAPKLTLQEEAEIKLNKNDSILELDVVETLKNFIGNESSRAPEAIDKLSSNYVGYACLSNLVSEWINDFTPTSSSSLTTGSPSSSSSSSFETNISQKDDEDSKIERILLNELSQIVKTKFDSEIVDQSVQQYKDMPRWLKSMTRDENGGKAFLMELYEQNPNCVLLKRCMIYIHSNQVGTMKSTLSTTQINDSSSSSSSSSTSTISRGTILASNEIFPVYESILSNQLETFRHMHKNSEIMNNMIPQVCQIVCQCEHAFLFTQELLSLFQNEQQASSSSTSSSSLSTIVMKSQRNKHRRLQQELEDGCLQQVKKLKTCVKSTKLMYHLSLNQQAPLTAGTQVGEIFLNALTNQHVSSSDLAIMHAYLLPDLPQNSMDPTTSTSTSLSTDESCVMAHQFRHPVFIEVLLNSLFVSSKRQSFASQENAFYHIASLLAFITSFKTTITSSSSRLPNSSSSSNLINTVTFDATIHNEIMTNLLKCSYLITSKSFENEIYHTVEIENEVLSYIKSTSSSSSSISYGVLLHCLNSVGNIHFLDRYHLTPISIYLRLIQHIFVNFPLLRMKSLLFLDIILNNYPKNSMVKKGQQSSFFTLNDHQKDAITCLLQLVQLGMPLQVFDVIQKSINLGNIDRKTGQDFIRKVDDFALPPFSSEV